MSNRIHWLALHGPLTVIERSNHSFDPFPDQNRSIPFGTGAAIFYNYVDLWLRNDTAYTFQLRLWMTERDLCRVRAPPPLRAERHGVVPA